jgi:O-antigen/teichoic acid export membrane protein
MSDSGRDFVKNIIAVFSTKIFVLLIGLIGSVLIARGLGVEGRGIYAALLIYPSLLNAITEGGMRQAAIIFIGKKKAPDAEIIGTLFTYIIFAGIGGYAAVYFLQFYFGDELFTHVMMLAAAGILPTTLAVNAIKGVFLGKERINQFNKANWLQKCLFVGLIAILYFSQTLTVTTAIMATLSAAIFNMAQALSFLRANETLSFRFKKEVFWPMFKLGIVYAIALSFMTANYRIDILILSWISLPSELGNYAVAVQLGELLWQLPKAVLVVLMAKTANSKGKSIVGTVAKTCRLTLLLTILSAIPLGIACYYLITPIFGIGFANSYIMLIYMLPGLILGALFKTIHSYFAGQGKPYITIWLMGFVVATNITLNFLIIPILGGQGAAIATSVSYIIAAVGSIVLFNVIEKVRIIDMIVPKRGDFTPLLNKLRRIRH